MAPIILATHMAIVGAVSTCDTASWGGDCHASNSGSQVDIGASEHRSPSGGSGSTHPRKNGTTPQKPAEPETCLTDLCRGGYSAVRIPDVTLADLASFIPARPTLSGEPKGVGVVGMPTNFVASAREQRMPGHVLDFDLTVRFRPAGFVFDYGDGTTRRTTTGGTSWERAGAATFTPTATSHAYAKSGRYPVSVTVLYSASVDFGSGVWRPVQGFVRATTGGYDVRIVEVHTALVDRTCLENPAGPGC